MSTAFSWTPWASSPDLLGEREGHCATSLVTLTNSTTANSVCQPHVVVIGGYYDGELTPVPVAAEIGDASGQVGVYATVHPHKPLQWFSMTADEEVFARDGASFTSLSCLNALLFGGLNGSYERTNALHAIELFHHPSTGAVDIRATALATTGNAPTPRLRHGAGTRDGRLYIFGGETDQQEQSNELYVLDVATCVWRQIYYPSALPIPAPRLLSPSLVFITGTIFLMYGGAQFVNGEIRSLCDVWGFDTTTDSWTCVHAPNDTQFPPSNGHAGVSVGPNSSSAVFVGGKNISEGCDDFRLVHYDLQTGTFLLELCPPTTDDYPHWRYTPALVAVPDGMLLLAGQCRHPQRPSCYHASLLC